MSAINVVQILPLLEPTTHQLPHRFIKSWKMPEELLESLPRNGDGIDRRAGTNCCIAWLIRDESCFAENVAAAKCRHAETVAFDDRFPLDNKVNFIPKIATRENALSGFEMLPVDGLILKQSQLRDVPWKKSVENPVGDQAQLTIQTWKLRDVNATPKQPGKEPFKMETETFRHGRAPAEGAKFPKSCKSEVRFLCAAHRGHNVLGTSLGLAEGMLCGWR